MIEESQAFPRPSVFATNEEIQQYAGSEGMTYRQWLAGKAMEGVLSGCRDHYDQPDYVSAAEEAVKYADALIARLEQTKAK